MDCNHRLEECYLYLEPFCACAIIAFDNNDAAFEEAGEQNFIVGVTLLTRGGEVVLRGNTIFNGNLGSALTSSQTNIIIDGDITIANTTGFVGSLRLTDLAELCSHFHRKRCCHIWCRWCNIRRVTRQPFKICPTRLLSVF